MLQGASGRCRTDPLAVPNASARYALRARIPGADNCARWRRRLDPGSTHLREAGYPVRARLWRTRIMIGASVLLLVLLAAGTFVAMEAGRPRSGGTAGP